MYFKGLVRSKSDGSLQDKADSLNGGGSNVNNGSTNSAGGSMKKAGSGGNISQVSSKSMGDLVASTSKATATATATLTTTTAAAAAAASSPKDLSSREEINQELVGRIHKLSRIIAQEVT